MIIKTYAIDGLSEWHGDLMAGTISVRVSFTGGTASPSGALPAYFVTKDPVTQFVIEHSKEFKSGFIRIDMQQTVAGEHPRMGIPSAAASDNKNNKAEAEAEGNGVVVNSEPTIKVISVADKAEAVEWLKEHYPDGGYSAYKLRGKDAFEQACKECNVTFEIQG